MMSLRRAFMRSWLLPLVLALAWVFGVDSFRAAPPPAGKARAVTLDLDASDVGRKILHAKLVIPVQPGAVTLQYPKWIPGEHGPTGPITDLAGLKLWRAERTSPGSGTTPRCTFSTARS